MSTLSQEVERTFGRRLKIPGIFKRGSIVTTAKSVEKLLYSYLDEREKPDLPTPKVDDDSDYSKLVVAGLAPQRPGRDYRPFKAGLHVFGFAREAIWSGSNNPDQLSDREIVERLSGWWLGRTSCHKKKGYHVIFSLDPRVSLEMGRRGIPVDPYLLSAAWRALLVYNSRFYPNAVLAGVFGCHHDRHHSHAHGLIFPFTSAGKGLNLSGMSSVDLGGKRVRVDFNGTLYAAYHEAATELQNRLLAEPERAIADERLAQKLIAIREAQVQAAKRTDSPDALVISSTFAELTRQLQSVSVLKALQDSQRATYAVAEVKRGDGDRIADSFVRLANEASKQASDFALVRGRLAELAAERRADPFRYRRIFYTEGFGISPSGSRSFLSGHNLDSLVIPNGEFDLGFPFEAALEKCRAQLRPAPASKEANELMRQHKGTLQKEEQLRHVRALYNIRSAVHLAAAVHGVLPPQLHPATEITQPLLAPPESASDTVSEKMLAFAKSEVAAHRPFSPELDANKVYAPHLIKPPRNHDPSEPAPAYTPPVSVIPEHSNFLNRDTAVRGVRSPEDLLAEEIARLRQIETMRPSL